MEWTRKAREREGLRGEREGERETGTTKGGESLEVGGFPLPSHFKGL